MGAVRDGYASDMTRMVFLGRPSAKVRKLYEAVLEAQLAAIAAVREGVAAESVDRAARRVLRAHGLDRAFVHATGHGLGLEIHEAPRLGKRREDPAARRAWRSPSSLAYTCRSSEESGSKTPWSSPGTGCEILTPTSKELLAI